jgi:hypothetical protein
MMRNVDIAGYRELHKYMRKRFPKPGLCQKCGIPDDGSAHGLELSNNTEAYSLDLSDWRWLCNSCHKEKDNEIYRINCIYCHQKRAVKNGYRSNGIPRFRCGSCNKEWGVDLNAD